jgi:hypothetical protein
LKITFLHSSTPVDCHIAGTSAPKQLMVGIFGVKSSMLTLFCTLCLDSKHIWITF